MKDNSLGEIVKSKKTSLSRVTGYVLSVISFLVGKYFGFTVVMICVGLIALSYLFSNWYIKRERVNYKLIKFIAWSNTCAWFLPPLGLFAGISSINFSEHDSEQKRKFKILGIIGITLSLMNATIGVIMHLN